MAKRKYEIQYKVRIKKTGEYEGLSNTMPSREVVEADSETNAIAKLKDSVAYKIASSTKEWEIYKVTPK
jgi:hypothetical protein